VFGYQFPFYFVQISPFNYNNINAALLREAQLETKALPKTGMAVTMDIGNLTDIHPKNKQEVGRRLALRALAKDYGRELVFSGPVYREVQVQNGKATLSFDQIGGGLATHDGQPPSHFVIAGDDKKFHPAQAMIDGDQVIVWSEQVSEPKAVRYGFTSDAQPNLINKAGLPASSFRTDRW
jgi:sialate O-acetylesterase